MGFFSWNCKGCGKSVRSRYTNAGHKNWMSQAVTEKGSFVKGEYDGYGRIGDGDFDLMDAGSFTPWHLACWEHCGSPTLFNGQSTDANDQGYFVGELLTLSRPASAKRRRTRRTPKRSRALNEIHRVLHHFGVDDEWPFKRVVRQMSLIHETNMAHLRRELEAKRDG